MTESSTPPPAQVIAHAAQVARAVLQRLGATAPAWTVLNISHHHEPIPPPPGLQAGQHLLITLGSGTGDPASVGVYYAMYLPEEQAIVATADQIQDHAIEATHGEAIPPCPDHQHPLAAQSFNGIASWVCPLDPQHHQEPIMSSADDET